MADENAQPAGTGDGANGGQPPNAGGTPPALDNEALKGAIHGALKDVLPGMLTEHSRTQPARDPLPRPQPGANDKPDPVAEFLAPYIAPGLAAAHLKAEGAADAATFYATNPGAMKHRDIIEQRFNEAMAAGRPFPRADVYKWLRGDQFDKFVDDAIEERRAAAENARGAEHAGGGSRPHTRGPQKAAVDMTDEELTNALKQATF